MKIAICANTSWNIFNFRLSLLKNLQKEGHEIIVVAPSGKNVEEIKSAGFKFISIENLSRKGHNPLTDLRLLFEMRKILTKHQIEIFLLYTIKPVIYGSLASWNTKTHVVSTITGLGYSFISTGFTNKVAKFLYKKALKLNNLVLFQNTDDRQLFIDNKLVSKEKSGVVPGSGIRTDLFYSVPKEEQNNDNGLNFLFIGRILKDKGIHELIGATSQLFEKNINFSLTIVGEIDLGNPSTVDQDLFHDFVKHEKVFYLGQVSNVKDVLEKCDVVILPSYREGIPRVLLEAMSMSKPFITTDVPGCRQVVKDGVNGFKVPVKNVQCLADTMLKMVSLSDHDRLKMGKAGRQIAIDNFDQKIINKTYSKIIKEITS